MSGPCRRPLVEPDTSSSIANDGDHIAVVCGGEVGGTVPPVVAKTTCCIERRHVLEETLRISSAYSEHITRDALVQDAG